MRELLAFLLHAVLVASSNLSKPDDWGRGSSSDLSASIADIPLWEQLRPCLFLPVTPKPGQDEGIV